jgi:hypothetical protein
MTRTAIRPHTFDTHDGIALSNIILEIHGTMRQCMLSVNNINSEMNERWGKTELLLKFCTFFLWMLGRHLHQISRPLYKLGCFQILLARQWPASSLPPPPCRAIATKWSSTQVGYSMVKSLGPAIGFHSTVLYRHVFIGHRRG